jgi:hypothetical protein
MTREHFRRRALVVSLRSEVQAAEIDTTLCLRIDLAISGRKGFTLAGYQERQTYRQLCHSSFREENLDSTGQATKTNVRSLSN